MSGTTVTCGCGSPFEAGAHRCLCCGADRTPAEEEEEDSESSDEELQRPGSRRSLITVDRMNNMNMDSIEFLPEGSRVFVCSLISHLRSTEQTLIASHHEIIGFVAEHLGAEMEMNDAQRKLSLTASPVPEASTPQKQATQAQRDSHSPVLAFESVRSEPSDATELTAMGHSACVEELPRTVEELLRTVHESKSHRGSSAETVATDQSLELERASIEPPGLVSDKSEKGMDSAGSSPEDVTYKSSTPRCRVSFSPECCSSGRFGRQDSAESSGQSSTVCGSNTSKLSLLDTRRRGARLSQEVSFEMLPLWMSEDRKQDAHRNRFKRESDSRGLARSDSLVFEQEHEEPLQKGRVLSWFLIHPCSFKRAIWDIFSLTLVAYDMVVLPLQFLEPPESTFGAAMVWMARVFWSFDLPISFATGFLLTDGSIQMDPKIICWKYFRSWFFLDVGLVVLDWSEFVLPGGGGDSTADASSYGRVGKAGRTFRILRMIRLVRMARMWEVVRLFTFRVKSEKVTIMVDIAKIMLVIVSLAHVIACFWYGICNTDNVNQGSWIALQGAGVNDSTLKWRYVLSLHWSLSQFTGGMDEIRAHNFKERAFNVVVFLAAFMMASVCVSALTSSMTRLHILASHQSRQISILRRYLIQNGIPDKLAMRVQRNALHAISEQQRLMGEKNVELLSVISEPLRVELHFEMYSPVLEVHPFFLEYILKCQVVMQKVCHLAMTTLLVSRGDSIFSKGEMPDNPRMYIVCNGDFDYVSIYSTTPCAVTVEQWVSEPALWIHHWMHRGTLGSSSDGRLCVLYAKRFADIVRQFEQPEIFNPRKYAEVFTLELNNIHSRSITDLSLGFEEQLTDEMLTAPMRKKDNAILSMGKWISAQARGQSTMMDKTPSTGSGSGRLHDRRKTVLMDVKKKQPMLTPVVAVGP